MTSVWKMTSGAQEGWQRTIKSVFSQFNWQNGKSVLKHKTKGSRTIKSVIKLK